MSPPLRLFGLGLTLALAGALTFAECANEPDRSPSPPEMPAPELTWGVEGCHELRSGPPLTCLLDGSAKIWARVERGAWLPPRGVGVRLGSAVDVDGGARFEVALDGAEGPGRVELRAVRGRARRSEVLRVEPAAHEGAGCPAEDAIEAAVALLPGARALPRARGLFELAACSIGRSELLERHLTWLEEAEQIATDEGALRLEQRARLKRSFALWRAARYDEALALAERSLQVAQPSLRMLAANMVGNIAGEAGDLGRALAAYEEARAWARRFDEPRQAVIAARLLIYLRERLGHADEARALARELLETTSKAEGCARVWDGAALFWWSYLRRMNAIRPLSAPIPDDIPDFPFDDLRALGRDGIEACEMVRASAAMNLSLEALERERWGEAERWLDRASAWVETPRDRVWLRLTRARWNVARGRPRAALSELASLGSRLHSPTLRWRVAHLEAQAHDRLGESARALEALDRAASILDAWPGLIDLDASFAGLVGSLVRAEQLRLELLLAEGRGESALRAARRERRRALLAARASSRIESLGPEERRAWAKYVSDFLEAREALTASGAAAADDRARSELEARARAALRQARAVLWSRVNEGGFRAPTASAPIAVVAPGRDRWWLLLADGVQVLSFALSSLAEPLEALDAALDAALSEAAPAAVLREADVLRWHAAGPAELIDAHASKSLPATLGVVYPLDLPPVREPAAAGRGVVWLAGSAGNLPASLATAERSRRRLEDAGVRVSVLGEGTSSASLVRALDGAEAFLFVGHAERPSASLERGLRIGPGRYLTPGDALALERAPSRVALLACGSARGPELEGATHLGVAQAFLLAGADRVLATTRDVADEVGARALEEVGRSLRLTESSSGAWSRALRALADSSAGLDLGAFRVLVP